jgi:hypothetical protein
LRRSISSSAQRILTCAIECVAYFNESRHKPFGNGYI